MDKQDIIKLIMEAEKHVSELPNLELKDARGGIPKDTWRSISAFSHKPGGGIIVFGIKEDRQNKKIDILGGLELAILQEKVSNLVTDEMSITIRPEYHILDYKGKALLAIVVAECPDQFKPCYYKPVGLPNGSYIRDGITNRKITDSEMRRFIENSERLKYDKQRAEGLSIEDIDTNKVVTLLIKRGEETGRKRAPLSVDFNRLRNLGIAGEHKGIQHPTIAGALIFAKNKPQQFPSLSRYIIRCVRYKGASVSTDIIDKSDIDGTLDTQIDDMQKFILRNIKLSAQIIGTRRVERYEYPEQAIREIVANAVIHRDYKITGTYTQVNVFEDRIEVFNPGCLPPGVTVENIKDAQASRNEVIAALLKDLDYLEEYGRGIDIVFNKMREWGLLEPLFKNTANSFRVILPGPRLSKLNERQIKIWEYLVEKEKITVKECVSLLPNIPRTTINSDLQKLQEIGLMKQLGIAKNTYYVLAF